MKLGKMLDKAKHHAGRRLPYLRNVNVRWGTIETDDLLEMNFEEDQLDRFGLKANDVLVCEGGEPGRASVWNGHLPDLKFQKALHRVRFKVPFDPRLLIYLLELLAKNGGLERRFTGSTIKHFTREAFVQLPVPFPPEDEQRRIVAEIEKQFTRLEAGVAALRRVQANLKRYRAGVLKAAGEGRLLPTEAELAKNGNRKATFETGEALLARILTERRQKWQGRGRYKEPVAPDTAELGTLPEGWTWASLEQIARSSSYGTSAKCSPDSSGPPVLRIPNIAGGRIDLTDLKFAGTDESIEDGDELAPGDLLIIRTNGSKKLIGRSAVVRTKLCRATSYASYLIRFRLFGSPTLFDWVGAIWDISFLRAWIEQRAATSAGQHNISMSVLSTMPIPLPPLAEQTRIVAEVERRLSVVEELEAVVSVNLQRAARAVICTAAQCSRSDTSSRGGDCPESSCENEECARWACCAGHFGREAVL